MFLLNMLLITHFLLVVSLYRPFTDFWKEQTTKKGFFISRAEINLKKQIENVKGGIIRNHRPLAVSKYIYEDYDRAKKSVVKLIDKNSLYLRRVACLGRNGEIVEAICCTDNYPRPWLILLPTKYKIECSRLDCQQTCYSAILDFREEKFSMIQPSINSNLSKYDEDYSDDDNEVRENKKFEMSTLKPEKCKSQTLPFLTISTKKKQASKQFNKLVFSNKKTPTIAIPEIVLELIDLCNYVNNSQLLQFEKIHSLCSMKSINLDDFLNHANYIGEKSQNVSSFLPTIGENIEKFVTESKINLVREAENKRTPTCEPEQFDETENICDDHCNESQEADCDYTTKTCNYIQTTEKRDFNAIPYLTDCTIKPSVRTTNMADCAIYCCNTVEPTTVINNDFSSCTHPSNNNVSGKESIKKILRLLLGRPRPTFSKKTNPVTHPIGKKMIESQISHSTVKLESSTSINYVQSHTVLKPAEKPSEEIDLLESYQEGDSVKHYATYIDNKCAAMYRVYKKAQWNYETNVTPHTKQRAMITSLEFDQLLRTVNKELTVLTKEHISNSKLQRQIRLLSLAGMNSLPELKSNEFEQVRYAMEAIYSSAVVSKWKHHSEKVSLNPVIKNVMAYSLDPEELKYYWVEWRKATGKRIKPFFEQYVSLMALAAKTNGFNDASEMWTRYYESEDLVDTLSVHWEEVKPLYVELHAYVRHKLHGLYGDLAGANEKGKIPAHLTGDIWSQNWKNLFNKVMSINNEDENIMKIELKNKITPVNLTKTVENVFLSMGFTELPEKFWKNSVFTKNNSTVMSCEPSAWDMGNGTDFRIKLCATPNMGDLFEIHHLVTLVEYYKEYKKLPYAFRNGANPGFTEAIAEAIVLSAHTKSSLKSFGINTQYENEINKLMRTALEKVAFIPYSYILILWRSRVFNGQINASNYNSEWWKLRSSYQGISPPVKRVEDDFDIGSKQHIAVNQPYIKYFLSTILQFQFYEALCKKSNFQGNLHNCDLTGSLAAGKILRNVMSMGSSYHWKVAMQKLTGTRKIDSKPLMRYFEPLLIWLKENNKYENVKVGWED